MPGRVLGPDELRESEGRPRMVRGPRRRRAPPGGAGRGSRLGPEEEGREDERERDVAGDAPPLRRLALSHARRFDVEPSFGSCFL